MTRQRRVVAHVVGVIAIVGAGFGVGQFEYRHLESVAAAAMVGWLGAHRIRPVGANSILVVPFHQAAFVAKITPGCSALASLLVLVSFGSLVWRRPRWLVALAASVGTVAAGNILRIALSLAAGLAAGRASLVLFHDWVGSVFGFAYTLGGFQVFLYLLLPSQTDLVRPGHV